MKLRNLVEQRKLIKAKNIDWDLVDQFKQAFKDIEEGNIIEHQFS